jgi:toxin ParE1/3/4
MDEKDRLQLSSSAQQDLTEIWLHIANDSPENADRFIDLLFNRALLLSEFPDSGRHRPELDPGLFSFPFRNYVFYYRMSDRGIVISRVLHGAREWEAI